MSESYIGTRRKGAKRRIHFSLPEVLAYKFDILCLDNSKGKPIYGERSQKITELLAPWIEEQWKRLPKAQENAA